jgi:hypothetical protein
MFAYWAIVFFGQSLENYLSSASSWAIFFHGANHELILTQKRFFQVIFSQTHQATLAGAYLKGLTTP